MRPARSDFSNERTTQERAIMIQPLSSTGVSKHAFNKHLEEHGLRVAMGCSGSGIDLGSDSNPAAQVLRYDTLAR